MYTEHYILEDFGFILDASNNVDESHYPNWVAMLIGDVQAVYSA